MLELIQSGGWLMWPIIGCSAIAMGIICERLWALQTHKVLPKRLVAQVWSLHKAKQLDRSRLRVLRANSPLGAVLATGLANHKFGREIMKQSIEDAGRQVVYELERFLTTLGTIASITPLLGLLGTVFGMIQIFSDLTHGGMGDPQALAGGIAVALLTTAAGLSVAIPSLMFHRYFQGRVNELVIQMEEEALKLIEIMHGEREEDFL